MNIMDFSSKHSRITTLKTPCLVLAVGHDSNGATFKAVDEASGGQLTRLRKNGDFKTDNGATLLLHQPQGLACERLLLVSSGKKPLDAQNFSKMLQRALKAVIATPATEAVFCLDDLQTELSMDWQATQLARCAGESVYRPDRFQSDRPPAAKLKKVVWLLAESGHRTAVDAALALGGALAEGINVCRELGDLPGNICTPTYLADQAKALAASSPLLSCTVLDEKKMRELGMGALLSVSAGSEQPPRFIVLQYRGKSGARKRSVANPTVLVGKGVTFDSGGISIKPGAGMDEMKYDMCGAASVLGTLTTLAKLELPVDVVGIVPAVENLPDGRATKPGDIVTSLSGQTIEILNTDAEGRLILCDALTYAGRFKPATVIDIATLTGACVVALGSHASGLMANDQALADDLLAASLASGDRAWQLPLWPEYDEQLKSNFADMANVGGKGAGTITAACFLERFCKDYRWAHLDIAGTAWNSGTAKGSTGRPVPLLVEYLRRVAQV